MPRIKRWFPVSHDINRDPEMWELCKEFGDKALRCWLEILSIADRNEGVVPGELDSISTSISWAIRCRSTKTRQILDSMLTLGWLKVDGGLKVTNYWKYHKTREDYKAPKEVHPNLSEPSEPYIKKDRNLSYIPKPKKTAFPENFNPSDGLRAWYSKQRVDDILPHVEAFRDYHVSRASRFLDWEAAFRTWVRNIGRFNGRPQVQKEGELSDRIQRALKRGL